MAQKVLIMSTTGPELRAEATGWTAEDPGLLRPGPIGMTPGFPEPYSYETPFHAMAAGWKLLAPPKQYDAPLLTDPSHTEWEWWFVRD